MLRSNIFYMENSIKAWASGKLLISGEYLVLAGATALALPLKFGQEIEIRENASPNLHWTSFQPGSAWFTCDLDPVNYNILATNEPGAASLLSKLLLSAGQLNPSFRDATSGCNVTVTANYPVKWGLGSSSTLIFLVAKWAKVDPFDLFHLVSEGSGYDIAWADRMPMIYYRSKGQVPEITDARPDRKST